MLIKSTTLISLVAIIDFSVVRWRGWLVLFLLLDGQVGRQARLEPLDDELEPGDLLAFRLLYKSR